MAETDTMEAIHLGQVGTIPESGAKSSNWQPRTLLFVTCSPNQVDQNGGCFFIFSPCSPRQDYQYWSQMSHLKISKVVPWVIRVPKPSRKTPQIGIVIQRISTFPQGWATHAPGHQYISGHTSPSCPRPKSHSLEALRGSGMRGVNPFWE